MFVSALNIKPFPALSCERLCAIDAQTCQLPRRARKLALLVKICVYKKIQNGGILFKMATDARNQLAGALFIVFGGIRQSTMNDDGQRGTLTQ